MKPISKRLFSLLLAVIVVLGLPFTAMAATEPDSSQASGDLPLEWQIISDNLPDPIPGYDPHDPDNPYPYGVPVDTFYPIEEIDPYAVAPAALDQSYIPEEMRDNAILRALEYTGYDVQYLKKNGYLYVRQYIGSSLKTNAPQVLSDIGYWSTGACPNGDETVADSSTVTGRAPKLSYFESNGLVCASFVTYYLCNYLPNIEGVDTSPIYEKAKEMGADTNNSNLYYLTTVTTWKRTLDGLASENGSGVTKYTDETKAYKNLVPGDVIVFASEGTLKHIAIYAGACDFYSTNGSNSGERHFIIHVGNSRGPEINTVGAMGSAGAKESEPIAWYHIDLPNAPTNGYIEVNKKDPDGKKLSGATFTAVNQSTKESFVIGPTNASGYAKSGELPLGTYVVTETVFPAGYEASGQSSWTVTLTEDTPNMTIAINAVNKLSKGVEFSILKVADIVQFSESTADGRTDNHVEVLYGINKTVGADFLKALGLENGAQRYANADKLDETKYFYQSDVPINALAAGLEANSTTVKNALEKYMANNGGVKLAPTDAYGKTQAIDLELGLYLCVETAVPEMVVSTVNPFLVSLPMTSVNGSNATDGGTRWIYDVTTFPKNLTGIPELEKTLREQVADTGKNGGSTTDIADGYAHTGTASAGDIIDYQIISTLPSITSESTYLTCYTFIDTLSKGISYKKHDVVLEFFADKGCTDLITTWKESDGFFTVTYGSTAEGESVMTVEMTARGLAEINSSKAVYPGATMVNSGYSDCTLRITYQATMDSDNSLVSGDIGNPNDVVLTWKRSNTSCYDTLVDDAHVYTYGIELTKLFSDGQGNFENVEFIVHNDTDNYFVVAELNEAEGIYYVTGHTLNESEATHFIPVAGADGKGIVFIKGLEDDVYPATEVRTDDGYTLLRDDIEVVITKAETTEVCDIYQSDVVGLIQNDSRYTEAIISEAISKGYIKTDGGLADILNNMPQKQLEHHLLTASATVDGNAVNMLNDRGSKNAHAPLTVVNTRGFDLPSTGDRGVWMYGLLGILLMTGSAVTIIVTSRKKGIQK